MKKAIDKVLSRELSLRKSSIIYNIPKSTLHDYIKTLKRGEEIKLLVKRGRFEPTFNEKFEQALVEHVVDMSNRCMPLTRKEFLKLAFDLAENLKLDHRFNKTTKSAGQHFYYDFIKRHPEISLRKPESTSIMRAVGFNKPQVDRFFENLKNLYDKFNFGPSNIFNCDETGVSTVHKQMKVMTLKVNRQVGKLTSAERGKNVTVLFCMSAAGYFIPPYFIFPRQRVNERLMINAPSNSIAMAQPNGWMNADFFFKMDSTLYGHCSHKSLAVITYAKDNHVHMLSTPPHTTHKLQPLDRVFMKPFKDAYSEACGSWMRANAGLRITEYEIAGMVAQAFTLVARLEIAKSGFLCTGIMPYNPNVFNNLDYLPSTVTDVPAKDKESVESQPSTSSTIVDEIHKVSPVPDASARRITNRRRKAEKSEILTSSPFKKELENKTIPLKTSKYKVAAFKGKATNDLGKIKNSKKLSASLAKSQTEATTCLLCLENNEEDWILCQMCNKWVHEACTVLEPGEDRYICDYCK
ncbi:uncharacterized protein [Prorops nasuta]|uniref:uncharacterized protein n=1 Tax=Prorops nasuta TaxID=863751 RepID=UPI0034CFB3E8